MSNWTPPTRQQELTELAIERSPTSESSRPWYAGAFVVGVLLVCVLGFATDLFDSGPTSSDVSAAYRVGIDEGTVAAETYWQEELEARWWESYMLGQSEGSSVAPSITVAIREGFSWEGGFDAGLRSPDIDLEQSYREGWMAGYSQAWSAIARDFEVAPFDATPPDVTPPDVGQRVQWVEWGGEP